MPRDEDNPMTPAERDAFLKTVNFGGPWNPADEPMQADALLENADWTKQSWDIHARDIDSLRRHLENSEITVEHFKTLPVYKMNVNKPEMAWLKEL